MKYIIYNGVQIWIHDLSPKINLTNGNFYINQMIDKQVLTFCSNPAPSELFYPRPDQIAPKLSLSKLSSENIYFDGPLVTPDIRTSGKVPNKSRWLLTVGHYYNNNQKIVCYMVNKSPNRFDIIDPTSKKTITTINSSKIFLVDHDQMSSLESLIK